MDNTENKVHKRRVRYSGTHPKHFHEKYKELNPEKYGDEIAAIIIGPYDMSVMLGTPFQIRSEVMINAVQKVFDICKEYNKSCGIFCDDEILSKKYKEMGANVFWACTDNVFFLRGFNEVFDALAEME